MPRDTKRREGRHTDTAKALVTKAQVADEMNPRISLPRHSKSGALKGRMDRRTFLGAASALGLSSAALPIGATRARAATPEKGGRLRVGITGGSTTDTLDPATFEDAFMQLAGLGCLHNYLTEIDAQGNLVPELAESWEGSDDARTWIFTLRKDVEFHNGKALDANDVIASLNHHRTEDSKSAAKPLVAPIESIRAEDKRTVVVELSSGSADFPYLLSDYHLAMLPADGDRLAHPKDGVGTGGYVLADYEPGVRLLAKRNPNYWKAGRAHFDEVEVVGIGDISARTNALRTGEVDLMNRCDLKTVHLLERTPGFVVEEVTGTKHFSYPMLTEVDPLTDDNVRMALKLAVDREALLKSVLQGHGALGNDHPIGSANRFHAADIPQREYDPEKARWHLKQAGQEGLKVQLHVGEIFVGAVDSAVLYREHAAKAGIELEVARVPTDGYWSNIWLKKPWCAAYWSGRATEDWMFSTGYAAGAPWNDMQWNHERFNMLLAEARVELNDERRRELYGEMQLIVRDEGGVVIPLFANYVYASSDRLQHESSLASNWDLDGFRAPERWWFA